jgi:hypothetical protein
MKQSTLACALGTALLLNSGILHAQSVVGTFQSKVTTHGKVEQTTSGSGNKQDLNVGSAANSRTNSFNAVVTTGPIRQSAQGVGIQQSINVGSMKNSQANSFTANVHTKSIEQESSKSGARQEIDIGSVTNSTVSGAANVTVTVQEGIRQTGDGEIVLGAVKNSNVGSFQQNLHVKGKIVGNNVRMGSVVGQERYDRDGNYVGRESEPEGDGRKSLGMPNLSSGAATNPSIDRSPSNKSYGLDDRVAAYVVGNLIIAESYATKATKSVFFEWPSMLDFASGVGGSLNQGVNKIFKDGNFSGFGEGWDYGNKISKELVTDHWRNFQFVKNGISTLEEHALGYDNLAGAILSECVLGEVNNCNSNFLGRQFNSRKVEYKTVTTGTDLGAIVVELATGIPSSAIIKTSKITKPIKITKEIPSGKDVDFPIAAGKNQPAVVVDVGNISASYKVVPNSNTTLSFEQWISASNKQKSEIANRYNLSVLEVDQIFHEGKISGMDVAWALRNDSAAEKVLSGGTPKMSTVKEKGAIDIDLYLNPSLKEADKKIFYETFGYKGQVMVFKPKKLSEAELKEAYQDFVTRSGSNDLGGFKSFEKEMADRFETRLNEYNKFQAELKKPVNVEEIKVEYPAIEGVLDALLGSSQKGGSGVKQNGWSILKRENAETKTSDILLIDPSGGVFTPTKNGTLSPVVSDLDRVAHMERNSGVIKVGDKGVDVRENKSKGTNEHSGTVLREQHGSTQDHLRNKEERSKLFENFVADGAKMIISNGDEIYIGNLKK